MPSGRKPGYKHSQETKERMRAAKRGTVRPQEIKNKISATKKGQPFTEEHCDNLSTTKAMYYLDEKCVARFEELKSTYPELEDFFLDHQDELIFAMRDVRTEKELSDIRRYVETAALRANDGYQYLSSSCYAAEDAMIELIDFKRHLQKLYH